MSDPGEADPTRSVYEARAHDWEAERAGGAEDAAAEAAELFDEARSRSDRPVTDLGCGPGWHTAGLGAGAIALDSSGAMLDLAATRAPSAHLLRADLAALPFAPSSLGGAWASKSYVHLARKQVPLALADLHRSLLVDAPVELVVFEGDLEHGPWPGDEFEGRRFSLWPEDLLRSVVEGAGFTVDRWERSTGSHTRRFRLRLRRLRTLPDTVGPDMRALVVGLNPSVYSADAGAGFARPGNRFWPAALASGLVSVERDPRQALLRDRVGMTDLVKRATVAAAELDRSEYQAGLDRLTRLVSWLEPAVVCIVGLAGWRAVVDRTAQPGRQPRPLGGRPVYLMPNTSGLNARSRPADFVEHFRAALRVGDANPSPGR